MSPETSLSRPFLLGTVTWWWPSIMPSLIRVVRSLSGTVRHWVSWVERTDVEPSSCDIFTSIPREMIWSNLTNICLKWLGEFSHQIQAVVDTPTKMRRLDFAGDYHLLVKFETGDDSLLTKWIPGNHSPKSKTKHFGGGQAFTLQGTITYLGKSYSKVRWSGICDRWGVHIFVGTNSSCNFRWWKQRSGNVGKGGPIIHEKVLISWGW